MSTPVTNLQIFANVTPGAAPALTVNRADGCVATHPLLGIFEFDAPLGFLSVGKNLLITASPVLGNTPVYATALVVSQTKIRVHVFDGTGALADPTTLTVSVAVVPTVS